jgi:hypothetical protein
VVSILKPEKDPTQPSSKRSKSLLDTVGKLFEKALLATVLREVNESGLQRDEQFGFRPRHSTTLQLARLAERVNRNFDERRLTGAVFLEVGEAFDTVWVKGLLYKLTVIKSPGWIRLHCPVQSVCQQHTYIHQPRQASAVRGQNGSRSHVPQSIASSLYLEAYLGRMERWL